MKGAGFSKRHTKKILAARSAGDDEGEHALDGRKRHMTMRLMSADDIHALYRVMGFISAAPGITPRPGMGSEWRLRHYAFTYQRTDVVTYREDGAIFVQGYGSTSTNIMLRHLLPDSVKVHCHTGWQETSHVWSRDILMLYPRNNPGYWWSNEAAGSKVYQLSNHNFMLTRGKYTYELVNPERVTKPWVRISVNKPIARDILASTRYREFMTWARMYIHMERSTKPERLKYDLSRNVNSDTPPIDAEQVKFYLSDSEYWPGLVALKEYHPYTPSSGWGRTRNWREAIESDSAYLGRLHADRLARGLRVALYSDNTAVLDRASLPFVRNLKQAQSALASEARWED
jgi:hypothetical protein